ncbi:feline leukemia virus subgroup C receptor-related protein 2-like [Argiope bruennichi]|uniref:feline leukemia virus subgroup C receptor-related protein 2-like n=1 Tax=Argiope bruennichi TaxID=94029 RepID=UPI0024950570|nr:feline leukemia virus subgroup C receptor-related protein 2-like [Argiope bruennichi]XP_055937934.1 feline leukemia virus subgroup C receptor-related protein 2-like [Argiope bruennichi]
METTIAVAENSPQKIPKIKVYKRRLWTLGLFSISSMMSAMTFPQYVVMANINSCFYDVSMEAVNWTAMIWMVVYFFFSFPMSYLMNNYLNLRWTVMGAAFFNVVATGLQFATTQPSGFPYVMLSAFVASLSNLFILAIPPFLAAKWFPSHELNRACAVGVFGNQLGIAIGFVLSPLAVSNECSRKDLITIGKRNVAYILTAVNIVIFILITFTFQNAPKLPPSVGEAQKKKDPNVSYKEIVLSMMKNTDFILIFIIYGLMVGSFFALGSTLNELILEFFPHQEVAIGWMGLLFIVCGLVGSLFAGYILDRTHKFKETTFGICFASLITFIVFSGCLYANQIWIQFITIGVFGFFLTSFLPIGFEYGIEVTYPQSEAICACLLNASTMFFGLILTEMLSHILESEGPLSSNAALTVILFLCCVLANFMTKDYKRSKQNAEINDSVSK